MEVAPNSFEPPKPVEAVEAPPKRLEPPKAELVAAAGCVVELKRFVPVEEPNAEVCWAVLLLA